MKNDKLLQLIPNFHLSNPDQKHQLLHVYAISLKWLLPGIFIISLIDLIVEIFLGHMPFLGILGMLLFIILIIIVTYNLKKQKRR
ncbi:hypothetical protein [Staphylococcus caeli]|uniref:Uncharacterized protein n=1 Tax=Staphylococcus caeli TaxID=2201815 RepID=A0A1D4I3F2_9STAP|nr:hypothetical protein [Staphylococcus caeli]SCS43953.1 Uncharacterised protein [Staphylococcus caeli]SCS62570.1 Uncharacterised protein [Staphylococcus caeli]